jgi:hypothetical protein
MKGKEPDSIGWLKEDPFPHLKTRDLLMTMSQGVVGGRPTFEVAVERLGLSDEEEQMTLSCLQLTDRLDAELTSAIPSPFYAYFWAHVSLVLRSHSLEGKLGHSRPEPGSEESDDEKFFSEVPSPIGAKKLNEVAVCISRDEFGRVLDIISDDCEVKITATDPFPTLYDAIEEIRRARDDANCVLELIEHFIDQHQRSA